MAKKEIGKMQNKHLGGGLSSLINPDKGNEQIAKEQNKQDEENKILVKTFNISEQDFEYIKKYALYRSFILGEKFTQKDVLNEAIALLMDKYKTQCKP